MIFVIEECFHENSTLHPEYADSLEDAIAIVRSLARDTETLERVDLSATQWRFMVAGRPHKYYDITALQKSARTEKDVPVAIALNTLDLETEGTRDEW